MPGIRDLRLLAYFCLNAFLIFAGAGSAKLMAQSSNPDSVDFVQVVRKQTPTVQWPPPASISYGTALGPAQLAATSTTSGTFTYTPAAGTVLNAGPNTLTATFTPSDTNDYNQVTATAPLQVNKAQATITLTNLQQAFTGSPVAITATTSPPGLPVAITYNGSSTPPISSGSYSVSATVNDPNYTGSATGTLVILDTAPSINLATSTPEMVVGNPVSVQANVVAGAVIPSGQVTFLDGATALGTLTLVNGQATLATSSLAVGNHSVTAVYGSGDGSVITSSPVNIVIISLSVTAPTNTQSVSTGSPAAYPLSIVPTSGTTVPLPTYLAVSNLPAGVTASISPSQWTQSANSTWTLPPNTPLPATTITFQVEQEIAHRDQPANTGTTLPKLAAVFLSIAFLGRIRRARKFIQPSVITVFLCLAGAMTLIGLNGCTASNGFLRKGPQTYTVTVTLSAGAFQQSANLGLIVK